LIRKPCPPSVISHLTYAILFLPWLALLAYCAKSGMTTAARLVAPYYPLLLPLILIGAAQSQLIRRRWWKILVGAHLILAFAILILTPDRPLWPAQTILNGLAAHHPDSHLLARAHKVYSVYAHRADPLADVRKLLPENERDIGFIGGADDCDISFWLPLGSRRVEHFLLSNSQGEIRERYAERDINYFVLGGANLRGHNMTIDDWLQKSGAELVASTNATLKVSEGPQPWFVARLK
ncbi:MAG TPA: hypothetical protein VN516_03600, partial [Candidatus Baltobacteraceae bacterium]|nr:hypothetical protein [Candidatus Baltobacteraceae bacterium]